MATTEEIKYAFDLISNQESSNFISEVIEDVCYELNRGETFSEIWNVDDNTIKELYMKLVVIEAVLFKKNICFVCGIEKVKEYNFDVKMFAFPLVDEKSPNPMD